MTLNFQKVMILNLLTEETGSDGNTELKKKKKKKQSYHLSVYMLLSNHLQ